jgi:hypothetical protein
VELAVNTFVGLGDPFGAFEDQGLRSMELGVATTALLKLA